MSPKSPTTALALTAVALATLSGASALPTTSSAAPFDRYDCHELDDGKIQPEHSYADIEERR